MPRSDRGAAGEKIASLYIGVLSIYLTIVTFNSHFEELGSKMVDSCQLVAEGVRR